MDAGYSCIFKFAVQQKTIAEHMLISYLQPEERVTNLPNPDHVINMLTIGMFIEFIEQLLQAYLQSTYQLIHLVLRMGYMSLAMPLASIAHCCYAKAVAAGTQLC